MNKKTEQEVIDVLKNPNDVHLENIQEEELSPLNQAVIDKEIAGVSGNKNWNLWKPQASNTSSKHSETTKQSTMEEGYEHFENGAEAPLDPPEQDLGEGTTANDFASSAENFNSSDGAAKEPFELPTAAAKQAADSLLGTVNNLIDIGGGYFVKIKKHKEFYDFEEILELIEVQNDKNIKRIQLDKEDKALLRPLLIEILKRKAQKLTPERQLMVVVISILFKKGRTVLEIKEENEVLVDRILDIIREEKGYSDKEVTTERPERDILDAAYEEINGKPEPQKTEAPIHEKEVVDPIIVEDAYDEEPQMENTIIEVAEKDQK